MSALDHLILFADLVGSTDVACELPIQSYAKTYIASFHWAAYKAYTLLNSVGSIYKPINAKFKSDILKNDWNIIGDQLTLIVNLNGRSTKSINSLVAGACTFAYNLKLFWLFSPYNLCRLQNRQFPRDLAVGIHIGPLANIFSQNKISDSAGLHLSVAKRIETEARTGIESRIFASPDIVHIFNDWKVQVKGDNFKEEPPIRSTEFRRLEKSIDAKGIPKPLRVSELEWNDQLLNDDCFWKELMDKKNIPKNFWDNTADKIAAEFMKKNNDIIFSREAETIQANYGSHLIKFLLTKPEDYIMEWFAAIQSRPKIFADEAWLVLNQLFITIALYRYMKNKISKKNKNNDEIKLISFRKTTKKLLDDWNKLQKYEMDQKKKCPFVLAGLGMPILFGKKGDEVKKEKSKEKEKKIIAYCGIDCGACPAYVATRNDDDVLRAKTAKEWSALYKAERKVEDINCDGCTGDSGRLFAYCGACEVRQCAREKKVSTCAVCPEYSCARLDTFCALMPTARALLEGLRNM